MPKVIAICYPCTFEIKMVFNNADQISRQESFWIIRSKPWSYNLNLDKSQISKLLQQQCVMIHFISCTFTMTSPPLISFQNIKLAIPVWRREVSLFLESIPRDISLIFAAIFRYQILFFLYSSTRKENWVCQGTKHILLVFFKIELCFFVKKEILVSECCIIFN